EEVKEFEIQVSKDGTNFEKLITSISTERSVTFQSVSSERAYYRIRAITRRDESSFYSNVISLGGDQKSGPVVVVNTLVKNEVKINSTGTFNYAVIQPNGQVLASGKLSMGFNKINLNKALNGLLLLRITTAEGQFTEKLLKQ
ncbi:MAG TPA: hypothetical protein VJT83_01775, partial [Chitinophagaceae bacterium]|nr:hypothetical protein [Chitinophagaceae bacterium]